MVFLILHSPFVVGDVGIAFGDLGDLWKRPEFSREMRKMCGTSRHSKKREEKMRRNVFKQ